MSESIELRMARSAGPGAARAASDADPPETSEGVRFVGGTSLAMRRVLAHLDEIAAADCGVLITGETGTGKGVVARTLHARSDRAKSPFVHVDCSALSPSLIESELFGHERGAFTGAHTSRPGRFTLAARGTIFLDEIGELDVALQVKLLRVLQDRVFEPIGSDRSRAMSARVIAATNRDLDAAIATGEFRADLMYRLAVVELRLPPLRERPDDLPALLAEARRWLGTRGGPRLPDIEPAAVAIFRGHAWPGNVRELFNVLERLALFARGRRIGVREVQDAIGDRSRHRGDRGPGPAEVPLERVLADCQGNVALAARQLGVPRSTLRYRIARRCGPRALQRQLVLPGLEPCASTTVE